MIQQFNFSIIRIDWMLLLLPMPFFIGMLLDTLAWKQLLPPHLTLRFKSLFGAQVGTEAVLLSIPGGFAMTDPIKLYILKQRFHIPPLEVFTSLITRHWLLGITQLIFISSVCLFGFVVSEQQLLTSYIQDGTLFIAISVFITVSLGLGFVVRKLMRSTLARDVWKILYRMNIRLLREKLKRAIGSFKEADRCFEALCKRNASSIIYAAMFYLLLWTMDVWETMLVAHATGFQISIINAFLIEAVLSAVRLSVFFLPGGVVVKELGYFALFTSFNLGISMIRICSFVLIKRLVSILCILIGYLVLLRQRIGTIWKHSSIPYQTIMESQ